MKFEKKKQTQQRTKRQITGKNEQTAPNLAVLYGEPQGLMQVTYSTVVKQIRVRN
jgi:hypothetical protein